MGKDHRVHLNDYIRSLTSSNPRILRRDTQLAYWINLYNALTVEVVLRHRRIHYAVNCASLGCPNLRSSAYNAANVEALLSAAEADHVNHPRGVAFTANGKLRLSRIFKWYRSDFGASRQDLLNYLARHHTTLSERISGYDRSIGYRYDWNLNRLPIP